MNDNLSVQVLVATMNQEDHSLIDKMNIQSNAIIGNQCEIDLVEHFKDKGNQITYLSFNEKGVGLNRNNCLMRASGKICLFADDDMIYVDNYPYILNKAYADNPKADVIIFNLIEKNSDRYIIKKKHRVHFWNFLRYGTARVSFKLDKVKENGIYFNQCFGGGTEHCHGEDNLFLSDCLKKGLKIYAVPISIATLTNERESTWANATSEKYLRDQGILYKTMNKKLWKLLCLQDCLRHHKSLKIPFIKMYTIMTGR